MPNCLRPLRLDSGLLVCAVAAAIASSSCAWLRYEDQIRTHVELMERIAADAVSAVQGAGYRLRPADLQTMAYPLERAAALRARLGGDRVDPALRDAFGDFVQAYSRLYEYLDRVRSTADEPRLAERVDELLAGVDRAARRVRTALVAGG